MRWNLDFETLSTVRRDNRKFSKAHQLFWAKPNNFLERGPGFWGLISWAWREVSLCWLIDFVSLVTEQRKWEEFFSTRTNMSNSHNLREHGRKCRLDDWNLEKTVLDRAYPTLSLAFLSCRCYRRIKFHLQALLAVKVALWESGPWKATES